ncbi:unnamed protein product [Rotaria sp. Silwood1]|nr:unnamed protein product [Rotaria sp. Silwood1]
MPANVTGTNIIIFHAGEAAVKAQFFQDLLIEIQNVSSIAFETIFAIDIFNEISVSVQQQPFSLTSGIVSFGATAIKSIAPTILVTASLFSPNAVGHDGFDGVQTRPPNADDRYPLRPASLINRHADYIDLHVYASENTRAEFEGAALSPVKPILMSEMGAFKNNYPNVSSAAIAIQNVMIESLNYGFVGWGT